MGDAVVDLDRAGVQGLPVEGERGVVAGAEAMVGAEGAVEVVDSRDVAETLERVRVGVTVCVPPGACLHESTWMPCPLKAISYSIWEDDIDHAAFGSSRAGQS